MDPEKVGTGFSAELMESARTKTWEAVEKIASLIRPGMLEIDARQMAERVLKELGSDRCWHKTHVRFGVNTLETFADLSLPGVRLQKDDLFFLDLGPVWQGYEGDAGATFYLGSDPEKKRCAEDAKRLFSLVRNRWKQTQETGSALYQFALRQAKALGWEFNLRGASGHRLSDFPHVMYHKGTLEGFSEKPAPLRWVLEIQIRHPKRMFGAFFEDVLV